MIYIMGPYLQKIMRMFSKTKLKYLCLLIPAIWLLDLFGIFTHMFELSYEKYFEYPYNGDVHGFVEAIKNNKKPGVEPINDYNYSYIHFNKDFCVDKDNDSRSLRIIFLIKSSAQNFQRRVAIRNTWGFNKRFIDVPTRTIFLLGVHENDGELQRKIDEESLKYKDILQGNFIDSYYNNTIKTMIGFKWVYNYCRNSKFYMFVDDDMYVSVKNVLRFIRNPANYPEYLKDPNRLVKREIKDSEMPKVSSRTERAAINFQLPDDVKLFAGYVDVAAPQRDKISKWYVSLDEYPYDLWPSFVPAGAYILSKAALVDLYLTSLYTQHFRFDDIFLAIVAKKANIEPFHCDEFYPHKKEYNKFDYDYVIASHGYGDPDELVEIWNEQKSLGNT